MPLHDIVCPIHGEREVFRRISDPPPSCDICQVERPQVISSAPYFIEDRLRFWRGPLGTGYSHALGGQMPESRAARDRLAKERGVEFMTLAEHKAENKEAAAAIEYAQHVKEGGSREPWQPAPSAAFQEKPEWAKRIIR